jgi:phage/plasmid-like protein (TIGR03299 family)
MHNIDMSNGRANLAFRGEKPWHELGTEMPDNADLNEWRKQAGLDFIAKMAPVKFYPEGYDMAHPAANFSDKSVIYREDTRAPLGIADSRRYKIVQPAEIIAFFEEFTRAGDMKLEVAGSILGGRRIWALARHEMEIRIMGQDVVRPYFNLTTSFDGETATIGTFTSVRVVCNNTLNMLYQEVDEDGVRKGYGRSGFYLPHSSKFNPEVAKKHIADLVTAATQFEQDANLMADVGLTGEAALKFFAGLVGVEDKNGKDLTANSRAKIEHLYGLFQNGPGAGYRSATNTVWGALNAVTNWADFHAKERKVGGRLASAWYGAGKELKNKAFKAALSLAKPELAEAA